MFLSINQLWELTGRDRKTIKKHLENVQFIDGEKSAHLYESSEALPLIYAVDNLEAARAKQALSQASQRRARGRFTKATHSDPNRARHDGRSFSIARRYDKSWEG
jgi:hypothetical protein